MPKSAGRPLTSKVSLLRDSRVSDDIRFDDRGHLVIATGDGKRRRCAGGNCLSVVQSRAKSNATMQNGEQICIVTLCLFCVVMVTSKRNAGYQPKKINHYYYMSCVTSLFSL